VSSEPANPRLLASARRRTHSCPGDTPPPPGLAPAGPEVVPDLARAIFRTRSFRCESRKDYDVVFLEGLLSPAAPFLADLVAGRRTLVVTTPTVARLYGPGLRAQVDAHALDLSVLELACTEQSKDLDLVARVCARALELGLDRRGLLIGMGGGVCTDLVTVAASWIRRGVAHVRIPTTLVGQVDAGIGIKGAVNFRGKKSYLGCFYPPEAVLVDPLFLRSLPVGSLRCGLAEIIKIALVRDPALFDLVKAHAPALLATGFAHPHAEARQILGLAAEGMLRELEPNPYENKTYRRLVDFGHTFSPLLEAASRFVLPHGEAVAVDMALSVVLAAELGLLRPAVCDQVLAALVSAGLPVYVTHLTPDLCRDALVEAAGHRGGAPNLVLPVAVGSAAFLHRLADLPAATLERAVQRLAGHGAGAGP
jgi:3-dehydroquinate synthase